MALPLQHPVVRPNASGRRRPEDRDVSWRERLQALKHLPRLLRTRVVRGPALARNLGDGIVALLVEAGFGDARELEHADHKIGPVTFVQATRR